MSGLLELPTYVEWLPFHLFWRGGAGTGGVGLLC